MSIAACARSDYRDLAANTRFELARSHGRYVAVNGLDTFVIVEGEGPDIVLLHGNPSSSYTWRHLIEPLAKHHRVHAIDLPGYGFSEKPADAPYTATWMAGHVAAYLQTSGIESAIVVGNSMGGEVASELAALYPRSVRSLILIAPAGLKTESADAPPLAMRIAGLPVVGRLLTRLPLRSVFAGALRDAYYDPSLVSDDDVDAYYAPSNSRNGLAAFLARMHRDPHLDRTAVVATIRAPTLIILGEVDRFVPLSVGRRYGELIPASRVTVIEKAGHLPQEERPDAVLRALDDWLPEKWGLSPFSENWERRRG
jgi:pimeloyl-ACP methyl ester carboxylesterase